MAVVLHSGSRAGFYEPSETTRLEPATPSFVYAGMAVAHYKTGRLGTVMYVSKARDRMVVDVAETEDDKGGEQWRWVTAFHYIVAVGDGGGPSTYAPCSPPWPAQNRPGPYSTGSAWS